MLLRTFTRALVGCNFKNLNAYKKKSRPAVFPFFERGLISFWGEEAFSDFVLFDFVSSASTDVLT